MKPIVFAAGSALVLTLVACGGSSSSKSSFLAVVVSGNNELSPFIMSSSSAVFSPTSGTIILDEVAGPRRITLTMPNDKINISSTFTPVTSGFQSRYDNQIDGSSWLTGVSDTGSVSLTVIPPNTLSIDFSMLQHSTHGGSATGTVDIGDATDHLVTATVSNAVWGTVSTTGLPNGGFSSNAEMTWELVGSTSTLRVLDNANQANETYLIIVYPSSAVGSTQSVTASGISVKYFSSGKEWDASAGTLNIPSSTLCSTATNLTFSPVTSTGATGTITGVSFPGIGI